jgi:mannose-6-phosphate isomerase-like protein (cupin superfamily)
MRAIHGRDITSDDSEDSLRAAILSATDEQEALNAFGVTVKPLIRAEQTGGTLSTYHLSMEPGIGSPFHVHRRDDETFYVLEGTFAFRHGDEIVTLGAGSNIFLPRNMPHYFRNIGPGRGVLLGIGTPGGHERFFEDASRLAMPPDPAEAMAVVQRYGMELLPE